MSAETDRLKEISALLQEGKVNEANELAKKSSADIEAAEKKALEPAEPPPPRTPNEILADFITEVSDRLGHPARLANLATELRRALAGITETTKPTE